MHVDLLTLYLLAIGTLLASAGMTLWEHRTNPKRSKSLRLLAAGYTTLAVGCAAVLARGLVPMVLGSAISHLLLLSGYLLILAGVASLSGRRHYVVSVGLLVGMALVWTIFGARWHDIVWSYVCAVPITIVSIIMTRDMLRCEPMRSLNPRHIVVAVAGVHALLYAGRAVVLPGLVAAYGPAIQAVVGKFTIYEGVLYSVILPMALLKLVRDEAQLQLLHESQTDYLTRLGNRRWFFEQGARIINGGAKRRPISMLAFDLDRFKSINDRYGHHTGDKVLTAFAEIARGVLGPDVLLARIGGEEFAALLAADEARHARALGETVAKRFAQASPDLIPDNAIPATVSIGLAEFESEAPPLIQGLAAADKALYRAKSLGGNRLETSDESVHSIAA